MDNEFSEILETFISESTELLEKMENALYQLETDTTNNESINSVFRAIHTIKGTAGMFGFENIVHFTHDVENLLDQVRDGKIALTHDLVNILLEARDHTQELIEIEVSGAEIPTALKTKSNEILKKLAPYFNGPIQKNEVETVESQPQVQNLGTQSASPYWHITLRPGRNIFQNALDPYSFIQYLNKFGSIKNVLTVTGEIPTDTFNPETCYLSFEIALESSETEEMIRKSFDFLEYDSYIKIIPPGSSLSHYKELIDTSALNPDIYLSLLVHNGFLNDQEANELKSPTPKEETQIVEEAIKTEQETQSVETETEETEEIKATSKQTGVRETKTLRVDSGRIDQLINLVGELVISGANITQLAGQESNDSRLIESSQVLLRLIGEIRENTLKLRMVPIGETFQKFSRIVREVGRELGKEVKLHISGGDTELDKTVIEKINDPLVHIIRNAIDHGLETIENRSIANKPSEGNLYLSAYHETGNIVIKIEDDGRGLNKNKILEKAISKGLLNSGQTYTDSEIYQTIFSPGLSTADKITNISGRGVGLDVVQRNIEALRGNIAIHSKEGKGTTFIIRLPLTLAIIDGFLVGVAKSLYIIPLDMILECVDMDRTMESNDIEHHGKSDYINLRGEVLPILHIAEIFKEKGRNPGRESIVIVQYGEKKAGLVVDKLYGEIQTVIKPLGKLFDSTKFLSGATILGNGDVAMILDIGTLITQFINEEIKEKSIVI